MQQSRQPSGTSTSARQGSNNEPRVPSDTVIAVFETIHEMCILNSSAPTERTIFHSTQIPPMRIVDYGKRVFRYSHCSDECILCGLIYIKRYLNSIAQQQTSFRSPGTYSSSSSNPPSPPTSSLLTLYNAHRLVVTAVMLAAKTRDDEYYSNGYYSAIGGVAKAEMNVMEITMLEGLSYNLWVSHWEYYACEELILNRKFIEVGGGGYGRFRALPPPRSLSSPPHEQNSGNGTTTKTSTEDERTCCFLGGEEGVSGEFASLRNKPAPGTTFSPYDSPQKESPVPRNTGNNNNNNRQPQLRQFPQQQLQQQQQQGRRPSYPRTTSLSDVSDTSSPSKAAHYTPPKSDQQQRNQATAVQCPSSAINTSSSSLFPGGGGSGNNVAVPSCISSGNVMKHTPYYRGSTIGVGGTAVASASDSFEGIPHANSTNINNDGGGGCGPGSAPSSGTSQVIRWGSDNSLDVADYAAQFQQSSTTATTTASVGGGGKVISCRSAFGSGETQNNYSTSHATKELNSSATSMDAPTSTTTTTTTMMLPPQKILRRRQRSGSDVGRHERTNTASSGKGNETIPTEEEKGHSSHGKKGSGGCWAEEKDEGRGIGPAHHSCSDIPSTATWGNPEGTLAIVKNTSNNKSSTGSAKKFERQQGQQCSHQNDAACNNDDDDDGSAKKSSNEEEANKKKKRNQMKSAASATALDGKRYHQQQQKLEQEDDEVTTTSSVSGIRQQQQLNPYASQTPLKVRRQDRGGCGSGGGTERGRRASDGALPSVSFVEAKNDFPTLASAYGR